MSEYRNLDDIIDKLECHIRHGDELYPLADWEKAINYGIDLALEIIRKMPPADVRPVIDVSDKDSHWAELFLQVLDDVNTPIIMYDGEREAVRHGLEMLLDDWGFKRGIDWRKD